MNFEDFLFYSFIISLELMLTLTVNIPPVLRFASGLKSLSFYCWYSFNSVFSLIFTLRHC